MIIINHDPLMMIIPPIMPHIIDRHQVFEPTKNKHPVKQSKAVGITRNKRAKFCFFVLRETPHMFTIGRTWGVPSCQEQVGFRQGENKNNSKVVGNLNSKIDSKVVGCCKFRQPWNCHSGHNLYRSITAKCLTLFPTRNYVGEPTQWAWWHFRNEHITAVSDPWI